MFHRIISLIEEHTLRIKYISRRAAGKRELHISHAHDLFFRSLPLAGGIVSGSPRTPATGDGYRDDDTGVVTNNAMIFSALRMCAGARTLVLKRIRITAAGDLGKKDKERKGEGEK